MLGVSCFDRYNLGHANTSRAQRQCNTGVETTTGWKEFDSMFAFILGAFLYIFWTVAAVAIPATDAVDFLTGAPI